MSKVNMMNKENIMCRNKWYKSNYISIAFGSCVLIALVIYLLTAETIGGVTGVLLGIGVTFVLSGILNIIIDKIQRKKPDAARQNYIDYKDERNVMIRNLAKAKAGDISQWFVMGIAYILILLEAELWLIMICVGAFLLHFILYMYFLSKYSKEI